MNNSGTKTGLFLLELIIALLLFTFCAAICMRLFAGARQRTRDSDNLSRSVYLVTSAAECYKNSGGDLHAVQKLLGGEITGSRLIAGLDEDWNKTDAAGEFQLIVSDNGGLAEISVYETRPNGAESCIYTVTVKAVSFVA